MLFYGRISSVEDMGRRSLEAEFAEFRHSFTFDVNRDQFHNRTEERR